MRRASGVLGLAVLLACALSCQGLLELDEGRLLGTCAVAADCGASDQVCDDGICCAPEPEAVTCASACGDALNNCHLPVHCGGCADSVITFGDDEPQSGRGVFVDSAGFIYITGSFDGRMYFGETIDNSAGGGDVFVAKLGPDGSPLWLKSFGDKFPQSGLDITVDAAGNVYITGQYFNVFGLPSIDDANTPYTNVPRAFVAKLRSNGEPEWAWGFCDSLLNTSAGLGIAVDAAGDVYAAGICEGEGNFGGGPTVPGVSPSFGDIYLVKYAGEGGERQWIKRLGSSTHQGARGLALDGQGGVLLTGYANGAVSFDDGATWLISDSDGDASSAFLAKFSAADGSHQWSHLFSSDGGSEGTAVGVDGAGNVLLGGVYNGFMGLGGEPFTDAVRGTFIAKFDPAGAHVWSRSIDGLGPRRINSMQVLGDGHFFLTGSFASGIDLGGGLLPGAGKTDFFLAELDPSGAHVWSRSYSGGPDREQTAFDMAIDSTSGALLLTGSFDGDFMVKGGASVTSEGKGDVFLARVQR